MRNAQFPLLLLTVFLFSGSCLHAQAAKQRNSICLSTLHALEGIQGDSALPLLIRGDVPKIITHIRETGGKYKYSTGDIVAAELTRSGIYSLNATGYAVRIECPNGKLLKLNDVMVKHNNVDSAFYGYWPLDMPYDGSEVIIGIIDDPYDIDHPDFYDIDGNTRIRYLWDQTIAGGLAPDPFDYGTECDSLRIANGTCPSMDLIEYNYSHGSGVTGVAASSGLAANNYRGVAPNAQLILVALNFDNNYFTNVTDAVQYIYTRAAELGKPCVINTSVGTYAGSHDGSDITAQTIDALIGTNHGRALVAAAGNAGNFPFHLGYDVTPAEQFTWFKKLSYTNMMYFQLWADTSAFKDVFFRIGADNAVTYDSVGSTPYYNILNDFNFETDIVDSVIYSIPGAGVVKIFAEDLGNKYLLEVLAIPEVSTHYWRFGTKGNGTFDVYAMEATTGFSNFVTTPLPGVEIYPPIAQYKLPDTDQTIVSSWQCLDNVITVGSYTNRDTMTNYYGVHPPLIDEVGEIFYSSSHGPTRDGRIKPDICAPGARVLSTAATILTEWLIELEVATYISADGQHYLYNGTSFASPAVAGIVALYFQQNPGATAAEAKSALLSMARRDAFTGDALPDNIWGYGKADAFRTLTGPWGCSADDYTEPPENLENTLVTTVKAKLQWDLIPNAGGYQVWYKSTGAGGWIKVKTAGITKTLSGLSPGTEYLAKVRSMCPGFGFSEFSEPISFTTLPPDMAQETMHAIPVSVYPNPANAWMVIDGAAPGSRIQICNMTGQVVFSSTITSEEELSVPTWHFPAGIYQLGVEENGMLTTKSFVVSH